MATKYRAPGGLLLNGHQAGVVRQRLLGAAATARAGDATTFSEWSPEVYRHGNSIVSLDLEASYFCHRSGAAYVLVTGQLFTQVQLLACGEDQ